MRNKRLSSFAPLRKPAYLLAGLIAALLFAWNLSAEVIAPEGFNGDTLDLSTEFVFIPEDRAIFASPLYNDGHLERLNGFPHNWLDHYDSNPRVGWYRIWVRLPAMYQQSLGVRIFNLNDTDETYWNGVKIGGSGTIEPENEIPSLQAYTKDRIYEVPPGALRTGQLNLLAIRVQQNSHLRRGFAATSSVLELAPFSQLKDVYYVTTFREVLLAALIMAVGLIFLVFFAYRPSTYDNLFFGLSCYLFAQYFFIRSQAAFRITPDLLELKRVEYITLFFLFYAFLNFIYFFFRANDEAPERPWLKWSVLLLNVVPFVSSLVPLLSDDIRFWYEFLTRFYQPHWILPIGLIIFIVARAFRRGNPDAPYIAGGWAVGIICVIHDVLSSRFMLPYQARIGTYGFLIFLLVMGAVIGGRYLRLHKAIDRKNRELARLDELKDRFLSNISHELNDPIASILLNAEMLKAGDYSGEDLPESYDQLLVDGVQLKGLVQKMTIASRLESDQIKARREPVQLNTLINECEEQLREGFPDRAISIERPNADVQFNTDPDLLRVVLFELLKNSVQYGAEREPRIEIQAERRGEFDVLQVHDNGPGVAPGDLERIKQKFVRVDDSLNYTESGTGLGLYLADRLGEIMGGRLTLSNEAGGGLLCEVKVPV